MQPGNPAQCPTDNEHSIQQVRLSGTLEEEDEVEFQVQWGPVGQQQV